MPELTPQQKAQLDKNIKAMLSQGASEQDVISYATDFRARFDVKKKVSIADVGMAARGGGEVGVSKAPSGETTSIVSKPGVDVEAYNTGMRQKLGVPKVNLGSDLPQIKKAREEKEYLKLRGIEENDIIPFETAVFTGTVQPTQIKELANKPYGKKVINDVLRDHAPEAGGLSFDDDVFRNEQNAEQVAQVLQQKFRQQGLEIQNQNLFNLDKEVSETLNGLKRIDIAVSAGTGGGAANVSEYNLPQLNTSSPSDLGEALDFLSKSEGSSFEVNGRKLSQKEITDLSEKINEKLYYIKAGEPIHPEILSEEVSTKLANAVSKVDVEWKGDINYSPNQKQELVQKDIQYAEEGLNFLKDANKVAYNNIMNGILKKEKIADVDYEQLIGIGKRLENEKKFRGGEFVKDDDRDFRTYQTLKADEAKILSEKIKEMGFKNKAKIADKVIIKAALESGIDPNSKRVLDIRRDEALGGYGIVKGGGLTALARGVSQPFKSIQTTLNSIFDDPTFTYLNSRRYDYGDQIVPDAAGNYSDVLPSERGYKNVGNVFNKILEGAGQFATQVFTSRLGGKILSAPYRAAALSVPRAALTTTQATNIAAYGGGFLSTALQTYGQSYVDFLNKTGNPNKASLMAFIDTLGQSAIEVSILPDVKLAESMKDALGSAKRNLATDIMKVVEKGGGKEAAEPFIKKFVQEAGKVYGKEILGEEVSQNMYNYLVESIFSPETAEKRNLTDETKEVIKEASLSMVVPIVLGGLGGAKRNRKLTQDALHISAQNFETFTEAIENGRVKGIINPQDADAALNIIKIHQQSIENAPKEDSNGGLINAARQLEYAYQNTVEQVAKEKLSKITDEVQAEPVKKQIEEAQEVKRKIFNGAEMSGIPKEEKEEQPTIDQDRVLGDEEKDQELLTTLQELAQEGVKDQDLQFFVDQAANAPNQFIETYGEQVTQELLDKATTEQIQKGLEDARKFENNPNVSLLEKELETRGETIADFVSPQAKELADKVRKLKIDLSKLSDGGLQSNPLGLPVAVWNGAMDIVAATIEAGGQVADAVKRGINYIQKNHRGQWDKKGFNDQVMKELGVRGITVNGEDFIVKNDAKTEREFAETVNGWYSDLEQSVLDVKGDKGSGEQWKKALGNSDEAKWTGLNDWLSQQKGQVSKKDIQNYLKDNRIEIVEVVKSNEIYDAKNPYLSWTGNDDFLFLKDSGTKTKYEIRKKKLGFYDVYDGGENIGSRPTLDEAKELAEANFNAENGNPHIDKNAATKFQGYQLEGEKTNYKEVLVTMPSATKVKMPKPVETYTGSGKYKLVFENGDQLSGTYTKEEVADVLKRRSEDKTGMYVDRNEQFKSSHFDEPNILVHLRMNTRVDAEGKKVLFLEEVQSDWGQKGKKEGFEIKEEDRWNFEPIKRNGETVAWKIELKSDKNIGGIGNTKEDAIKDANKRYGTEINTLEKQQKGTPSAPFVTDTNAWTKLGLKYALKEAVKQGATKIAWTTGEQQNDRYDLSKQVNKIVVQKQPDGRYRVAAWKDSPTAVSDQIVKESEVEGIVGKEIAAKAINEGQKEFKGQDLKVGGKGMKGFYGSPKEGSLGIVGNVAKSLFKQEPKTVEVEVGDSGYTLTLKDKDTGRTTTNQFDNKQKASAWLTKEVNAGRNYEVVSEESGKRNSTQHSIDITPELKAEVEGGLPLFKDIKGRGKEIADLLRKGKIKMGGLQSNIAGIPIALYNTAIETIALALEGGATLTQAIQKAINKHKLNQQKNFNQKEFISKLEDITGEKFTDDQQEPPKPPKEEPSPLEGDEGSRKKAVLNRLYNAKNTPEEAKKAFEREKLDYKPSSQKAAADLAKSIVDEFGVDEAVRLADSSSMFEGDVRTLIFAEVLNRLQGERNAKKWAEVAITMDKFERSAGRATAAVNYFYKNNPYGVVLKEQADRKEAFDKWATPKREQEWKEYFELIKKEPEFEKLFQERVSEELKKERAESRKNRIVKVRGIFKKAKDSLKSNNTYATIIPPHILETVLETMELAYEGGEAVATLIQDAIDSISKKLGHSNWDSDKFRKEWEEKLKEPSNIPLTEAEQKKKILDKFRNKLSGLTNKQKDEVVRKMFEKVVDAGALEYDDLRDIIADTLGYGELTKDESKRLQELVQKRNATDEAALKAREAGEDLRNVKNLPETDFVNKKEEVKKKEKEAEQALENYYKTEIEAGKAARELQELLWNKPDVVKRITSIMQLSTLGIPALINNPIYNFFNQIGVRFPVGLVNSTIDKTASLVAKAMGKPYQREYNIFETQGEFWSKLMLGTKESAQQLFTGLNRQDYIQKEYYGQQTRPMRALKDLINYKQGKKKLNQKQIWDKALQASVGIPAEVVARVLNLGDKPMRFSAEGSQAAAFAKTLGLKGIDYKLFIEFPREEAYRAYKQKGLTEEEASTKADYVKEAIIQEGKRATFQQDNILNDIITAAASIFGGKDSGFANLTKSLVISPYIKIPTNAFWSYYNLINPEVAILQSFIHAGRAKSWSSKGNEVNAKLQMREARYWMAHAITGMATRAVVIMLVQSGVYVSGSGDDESKKERDAKSFFEQPGSINISKLKALINGEDPSKVKDGLLISNRWIGQFGTVGNAIVSKYEDATPEQREAQDDFWRIVLGGMELDALKEMENGIFANSSSLLQSISNQDFSRYGTNTLNMFANILQPATFAQMNRAALDEVPQAKGDTFLQKLNQNFAQRSTIYRNMFNVRLQYKRNMWGETMPKGGNFLSRMFGISRVDDKKDGRPMYDDFLNSTDSGFLPPVVLPVLNGEKLNTEQHDRLQMYVGNERKSIVLDFINDKLEVPILGLKYSQMRNNETKKAALQYLYQVGRENGLKLFYKDFSELEPKEKSFEEQDEDELLQKGLELIKKENSQ